MFVTALVITAILVDRFVLLPEFEAGGGSGAGAVIAWLSVNLMPAFVWLLIEHDSRKTRGQLVTGTLAVLAATALLILPALIWYASAEGGFN